MDKKHCNSHHNMSPESQRRSPVSDKKSRNDGCKQTVVVESVVITNLLDMSRQVCGERGTSRMSEYTLPDDTSKCRTRSSDISDVHSYIPAMSVEQSRCKRSPKNRIETEGRKVNLFQNVPSTSMDDVTELVDKQQIKEVTSGSNEEIIRKYQQLVLDVLLQRKMKQNERASEAKTNVKLNSISFTRTGRKAHNVPTHLPRPMRQPVQGLRVKEQIAKHRHRIFKARWNNSQERRKTLSLPPQKKVVSGNKCIDLESYQTRGDDKGCGGEDKEMIGKDDGYGAERATQDSTTILCPALPWDEMPGNIKYVELNAIPDDAFSHKQKTMNIPSDQTISIKSILESPSAKAARALSHYFDNVEGGSVPQGQLMNEHDITVGEILEAYEKLLMNSYVNYSSDESEGNDNYSSYQPDNENGKLNKINVCQQSRRHFSACCLLSQLDDAHSCTISSSDEPLLHQRLNNNPQRFSSVMSDISRRQHYPIPITYTNRKGHYQASAEVPKHKAAKDQPYTQSSVEQQDRNKTFNTMSFRRQNSYSQIHMRRLREYHNRQNAIADPSSLYCERVMKGMKRELSMKPDNSWPPSMVEKYPIERTETSSAQTKSISNPIKRKGLEQKNGMKAFRSVVKSRKSQEKPSPSSKPKQMPKRQITRSPRKGPSTAEQHYTSSNAKNFRDQPENHTIKQHSLSKDVTIDNGVNNQSTVRKIRGIKTYDTKQVSEEGTPETSYIAGHDTGKDCPFEKCSSFRTVSKTTKKKKTAKSQKNSKTSHSSMLRNSDTKYKGNTSEFDSGITCQGTNGTQVSRKVSSSSIAVDNSNRRLGITHSSHSATEIDVFQNECIFCLSSDVNHRKKDASMVFEEESLLEDDVYEVRPIPLEASQVFSDSTLANKRTTKGVLYHPKCNCLQSSQSAPSDLNKVNAEGKVSLVCVDKEIIIPGNSYSLTSIWDVTSEWNEPSTLLNEGKRDLSETPIKDDNVETKTTLTEQNDVKHIQTPTNISPSITLKYNPQHTAINVDVVYLASQHRADHVSTENTEPNFHHNCNTQTRIIENIVEQAVGNTTTFSSTTVKAIDMKLSSYVGSPSAMPSNLVIASAGVSRSDHENIESIDVKHSNLADLVANNVKPPNHENLGAVDMKPDSHENLVTIDGKHSSHKDVLPVDDKHSSHENMETTDMKHSAHENLGTIDVKHPSLQDIVTIDPKTPNYEDIEFTPTKPHTNENMGAICLNPSTNENMGTIDIKTLTHDNKGTIDTKSFTHGSMGVINVKLPSHEKVETIGVKLLSQEDMGTINMKPPSIVNILTIDVKSPSHENIVNIDLKHSGQENLGLMNVKPSSHEKMGNSDVIPFCSTTLGKVDVSLSSSATVVTVGINPPNIDIGNMTAVSIPNTLDVYVKPSRSTNTSDKKELINERDSDNIISTIGRNVNTDTALEWRQMSVGDTNDQQIHTQPNCIAESNLLANHTVESNLPTRHATPISSLVNSLSESNINIAVKEENYKDIHSYGTTEETTSRLLLISSPVHNVPRLKHHDKSGCDKHDQYTELDIHPPFSKIKTDDDILTTMRFVENETELPLLPTDNDSQGIFWGKGRMQSFHKNNPFVSRSEQQNKSLKLSGTKSLLKETRYDRSQRIETKEQCDKRFGEIYEIKCSASNQIHRHDFCKNRFNQIVSSPNEVDGSSHQFSSYKSTEQETLEFEESPVGTRKVQKRQEKNVELIDQSKKICPVKQERSMPKVINQSNILHERFSTALTSEYSTTSTTSQMSRYASTSTDMSLCYNKKDFRRLVTKIADVTANHFLDVFTSRFISNMVETLNKYLGESHVVNSTSFYQDCTDHGTHCDSSNAPKTHDVLSINIDEFVGGREDTMSCGDQDNKTNGFDTIERQETGLGFDNARSNIEGKSIFQNFECTSCEYLESGSATHDATFVIKHPNNTFRGTSEQILSVSPPRIFFFRQESPPPNKKIQHKQFTAKLRQLSQEEKHNYHYSWPHTYNDSDLFNSSRKKKLLSERSLSSTTTSQILKKHNPFSPDRIGKLCFFEKSPFEHLFLPCKHVSPSVKYDCEISKGSKKRETNTEQDLGTDYLDSLGHGVCLEVNNLKDTKPSNHLLAESETTLCEKYKTWSVVSNTDSSSAINKGGNYYEVDNFVEMRDSLSETQISWFTGSRDCTDQSPISDDSMFPVREGKDIFMISSWHRLTQEELPLSSTSYPGVKSNENRMKSTPRSYACRFPFHYRSSPNKKTHQIRVVNLTFAHEKIYGNKSCPCLYWQTNQDDSRASHISLKEAKTTPSNDEIDNEDAEQSLRYIIVFYLLKSVMDILHPPTRKQEMNRISQEVQTSFSFKQRTKHRETGKDKFINSQNQTQDPETLMPIADKDRKLLKHCRKNANSLSRNQTRDWSTDRFKTHSANECGRNSLALRRCKGHEFELHKDEIPPSNLYNDQKHGSTKADEQFLADSPVMDDMSGVCVPEGYNSMFTPKGSRGETPRKQNIAEMGVSRFPKGNNQNSSDHRRIMNLPCSRPHATVLFKDLFMILTDNIFLSNITGFLHIDILNNTIKQIMPCPSLNSLEHIVHKQGDICLNTPIHNDKTYEGYTKIEKSCARKPKQVITTSGYQRKDIHLKPHSPNCIPHGPTLKEKYHVFRGKVNHFSKECCIPQITILSEPVNDAVCLARTESLVVNQSDSSNQNKSEHSEFSDCVKGENYSYHGTGFNVESERFPPKESWTDVSEDLKGSDLMFLDESSPRIGEFSNLLESSPCHFLMEEDSCSNTSESTIILAHDLKDVLTDCNNIVKKRQESDVYRINKLQELLSDMHKTFDITETQGKGCPEQCLFRQDDNDFGGTTSHVPTPVIDSNRGCFVQFAPCETANQDVCFNKKICLQNSTNTLQVCSDDQEWKAERRDYDSGIFPDWHLTVNSFRFNSGDNKNKPYIKAKQSDSNLPTSKTMEMCHKASQEIFAFGSKTRYICQQETSDSQGAQENIEKKNVHSDHDLSSKFIVPSKTSHSEDHIGLRSIQTNNGLETEVGTSKSLTTVMPTEKNNIIQNSSNWVTDKTGLNSWMVDERNTIHTTPSFRDKPETLNFPKEKSEMFQFVPGGRNIGETDSLPSFTLKRENEILPSDVNEYERSHMPSDDRKCNHDASSHQILDSVLEAGNRFVKGEERILFENKEKNGVRQKVENRIMLEETQCLSNKDKENEEVSYEKISLVAKKDLQFKPVAEKIEDMVCQFTEIEPEVNYSQLKQEKCENSRNEQSSMNQLNQSKSVELTSIIANLKDTMTIKNTKEDNHDLLPHPRPYPRSTLHLNHKPPISSIKNTPMGHHKSSGIGTQSQGNRFSYHIFDCNQTGVKLNKSCGHSVQIYDNAGQISKNNLRKDTSPKEKAQGKTSRVEIIKQCLLGKRPMEMGESHISHSHEKLVDNSFSSVPSQKRHKVCDSTHASDAISLIFSDISPENNVSQENYANKAQQPDKLHLDQLSPPYAEESTTKHVSTYQQMHKEYKPTGDELSKIGQPFTPCNEESGTKYASSCQITQGQDKTIQDKQLVMLSSDTRLKIARRERMSKKDIPLDSSTKNARTETIQRKQMSTKGDSLGSLQVSTNGASENIVPQKVLESLKEEHVSTKDALLDLPINNKPCKIPKNVLVRRATNDLCLESTQRANTQSTKSRPAQNTQSNKQSTKEVSTEHFRIENTSANDTYKELATGGQRIMENYLTQRPERDLISIKKTSVPTTRRDYESTNDSLCKSISNKQMPTKIALTRSKQKENTQSTQKDYTPTNNISIRNVQRVDNISTKEIFERRATAKTTNIYQSAHGLHSCKQSKVGHWFAKSMPLRQVLLKEMEGRAETFNEQQTQWSSEQYKHHSGGQEYTVVYPSENMSASISARQLFVSPPLHEAFLESEIKKSRGSYTTRNLFAPSINATVHNHKAYLSPSQLSFQECTESYTSDTATTERRRGTTQFPVELRPGEPRQIVEDFKKSRIRPSKIPIDVYRLQSRQQTSRGMTASTSGDVQTVTISGPLMNMSIQVHRHGDPLAAIKRRGTDSLSRENEKVIHRSSVEKEGNIRRNILTRKKTRDTSLPRKNEKETQTSVWKAMKKIVPFGRKKT